MVPAAGAAAVLSPVRARSPYLPSFWAPALCQPRYRAINDAILS